MDEPRQRSKRTNTGDGAETPTEGLLRTRRTTSAHAELPTPSPPETAAGRSKRSASKPTAAAEDAAVGRDGSEPLTARPKRLAAAKAADGPDISPESSHDEPSARPGAPKAAAAAMDLSPATPKEGLRPKRATSSKLDVELDESSESTRPKRSTPAHADVEKDATPAPSTTLKRKRTAGSDAPAESADVSEPAVLTPTLPEGKKAKADDAPSLGELVDAKWPDDGRFYSAIVTSLPTEGADQFTVRFDDGVTLQLPIADLRRLVYTDDTTLPAARRVGAGWTPEELVQQGHKLLDAIAGLKQNRRLVASLFLDLPPRDDFPDYYKVIKQPIAINDIRPRARSGRIHQAKLDKGKHRSFVDVVKDLKTMVGNAKTYNEPESEVHRDAELINAKVDELVTSLAKALPAGPSKRPAKDSPAASVAQAAEPLPSNLKLRLSVKNNPEAPNDADPADRTDRPSTPALKPTPTPTLRVKVDLTGSSGKSAKTPDASEATSSNDHGPKEPKVKLLPLKAAPAIVPVHQQARAALDAIAKLHDGDRAVAELFQVLPKRSELPDYYIVIKKPISLKEISTKVDQNKYETVDEFMADVKLMVDNARFYNEDGSEVFEDANRIWAAASRAVAAKSAAAVAEPAVAEPAASTKPKKKATDAQADERAQERTQHSSASKKAAGKPQTAVTAADEDEIDVDLASSDNDGPEAIELLAAHHSVVVVHGADVAKGDEADRTYIDSAPLSDGRIVERGHVVYADDGRREASTARPTRSQTLVLVETLWTAKEKTFVGGLLLMLPHQTFHVATRTFHEQEIFRTSTHFIVPLTDVLGFAYVLQYKDYARGRPKGVPAEDVWLCESRYSDQSKSFDRLRNFARAFPEPKLHPNPELEVFADGPRKIPTHKSPHLIQAAAAAAAAAKQAAAAAASAATSASVPPLGRPVGTTPRPTGSDSMVVRVAGSAGATPMSSVQSPSLNRTPQGPTAAAATVARSNNLNVTVLYSGRPVTVRPRTNNTLTTSLGQLTVHEFHEPPLPAIRSLVLNQVGVIQRLSDGFLHVPQLLRGLGIPPDRFRALHDLLASCAAPDDTDADAEQRPLRPITTGPWVHPELVWRMLVGGLLVTMDEKRRLTVIFQVFDLGDVTTTPILDAGARLPFPVEIGRHWSFLRVGTRMVERVRGWPIVENDYLHAVGHELLRSVRLNLSRNQYRWQFAATEDRFVRIPSGEGQDLEIHVASTERCASLRLLLNGQVIIAEASDVDGPAVFRVPDLPAGPLALEIEATSKAPLPEAVPYPWELSKRYARPGTKDARSTRKLHRSVLTMCFAVEPAPTAL